MKTTTRAFAAKAAGLSVLSMLLAGTMAAGAASAQQAQYSSKDIIDTFAKKPAAQPAQPAPGECEKKGMITGEDGICEPTKNARGFSLPTRANMKAASAPAPMAAKASAPAAASRPTRMASTAPMRAAPVAAAPTVKKDLLITFKLGSAELTDQAKANAKVFAQAVNSPALSDAKFDLSGYTDASGDKDKNLTLSQARAASLKSFLVSQGVSDARLEAHGYGASDFAADPMSPRNRRVEAKRTQ